MIPHSLKSVSSTRSTSSSPQNQNSGLLSNSFSYHHEFNSSGSNLTKDHTSLFKKSLLHKWHYKQSILCMVASPKRRLLFCGTQNSSILVLDLVTFQKKLEISTHVGSVLCLHLSDCEDILFSGGSDSLVKIWNISDNLKDNNIDSYNNSIQLTPTHTIYSLLDVGDIFSITWVNEIKTVFIGSQNASMSFVHIDTQINGSADDHLKFMPSNRFDKFFDSKGSKIKDMNSLPLFNDCNLNSNGDSNKIDDMPTKVIQIPPENIITYAHNGYLYAIDSITIDDPLTSTIGNNIAEEYRHIIITGGGDGEIKLWGYSYEDSGRLTLLSSLYDEKIDSIFSFSIHRPSLTVYAGLSNGNVCVWDLATFQLLRIFEIDSNDVYTVALSPINDGNYPQWLFMGTEFGITKKMLSNYTISTIEMEVGDVGASVRVTKNEPCLALKTFLIDNEAYLVSAGSDNTISLWSLENMGNTCSSNYEIVNLKNDTAKNMRDAISDDRDLSRFLTNEKFLQTLAELIEFRTVSKQPDIYMDDCRKCANYLTVLLKSFGAYKTQLLPVPNGNPIVHAIFKANSKEIQNSAEVPRILWYGHYDVIPASHKTWNTPPFTMTPQDGYLYARGVTDNKGPLLVSIFAIAELYFREELKSDVIFVIEGEEEAGSWGFQNAVLEHQYEISDGGKPIDWILLSNSYWLDDKIPVLNYGLRGKIEVELGIWSDKPDRHSGVDGGVVVEPSMDLVKLLGKLVENDEILIPGFEKIYRGNDNDETKMNKSLQFLQEWEIPLYKEISQRVPDLDINELIRKWRLPSLSLHKIEMSGPDNGTVISQKAEAKLSIRIIPGQELENVKESFIEYVNKCFKEFNSTNYVDIKIMHEAEPWLGDVNNLAYKILSECLKEEWGIKPLFVREGGSIPSIRFLEKVFGCSAVHIPTGQSSDNAHLNNERVRIINLLKSREIIKKAANRLPKSL